MARIFGFELDFDLALSGPDMTAPGGSALVSYRPDASAIHGAALLLGGKFAGGPALGFGALTSGLGNAAPTLISEFQPNPDGTDPANVNFELSGNAGDSFDLWIVSIESDGANGLVDRASNVTGTFDSNGLAVVQIADLENPSFTVILADSFTGTVGSTDIDADDDGTADDLSAFGTILDAIGIPDATSDEASLYGADVGGADFAYTGAEPELVFRDASTGAWYAVNVAGAAGGSVHDITGTDVGFAIFDTDPTAVTDSFGAINPSTGATSAPTLISEFQPNPDGTDPANVNFELSGNAGDSFDVWIVSIESDGANGLVDRAANVTGTFDSNGLAVVSVPDLENPSFTVILTDSFTGTIGSTDIDADDDGTADDLSAFGTILDAIGIPDSTGDEAALYGADVGGADFAYTGAEPELVFRDASTGAWYAVNVAGAAGGSVHDITGTDVGFAIFDTDPTAVTDSFGAINPTTTGGPTATVSIDDVTILEGDAGTATLTFTVTRSDSSGAFTVDLATADGTATTADSDYAAASGTLTFTAGGSLTQTIDVTINGDTDVELDETFTVTLSNLVPTSGSAVLLDAQGTGTITNDDGVAITRIHTIQGNPGTQVSSPFGGQDNNDGSPLDGTVVTIEAVVVGDFQNGDSDTSRDLGGFYLQEEDADADGDLTTSEGIFVFDTSFGVDVNVGDIVRVTGTVDEYFGETQIDTVTSVTVISGSNPLPTAATIDLSAITTNQVDQDGDYIADLEAYEGMLVTFPDTLTVHELFQLDRFNEMRLYDGDRPEHFTQTNAPSQSGYDAHLQLTGGNSIIFDDGKNVQNDPILPEADLDMSGFFDTADGFGMGDTISGLTGVLGFSWAGASASGSSWRVRTHIDGTNTFVDAETRDAPPTFADASLTVASFNVLNFFTTLGSRGATDATEFARQLDKLVTAITELDADILGLIEIENDFDTTGTPPIQVLVDAINAVVGAGTYDWVDPGMTMVGSDLISQAFIYKTGTVGIAAGTTVEILDDSDPEAAALLPSSTIGAIFNGSNTSRPALAVTFEELASGETVTIAVNHFKSKGDFNNVATGSDDDALDGAANWNNQRLLASVALQTWLDTDPTGAGDGDYLIIGDLNAYAQEDPVQALISSGYTDLLDYFSGPTGGHYGYVFDGQTGTLDYGLANSALLQQIVGTSAWNANADEADALDYNLDFGRDPAIFDGTVSWRASDHDPVIIGLDLGSINGTPFDDSLTGGAANDRIRGLDGNDTLIGDSGFDTLIGGEGADFIDAGNGFDSLSGGDGNDTLLGGTADDTLFGDGGNDLMNGGNNADILYGGEGDDRGLGGSGVDTLYGEAGNDTLAGGRAIETDSLFGGTGDDVLLGQEGDDWIEGGDGNDRVSGGSQVDYLDGGAGNDTVLGGGGRDTLIGGTGDDELTGAAQADIFFFEDGFGNDTITDFVAGVGAEKINLTNVSAITDFADLMANHVSEIGGNTVIDDLAGNTITLTGVAMASLIEADFEFGSATPELPAAAASVETLAKADEEAFAASLALGDQFVTAELAPTAEPASQPAFDLQPLDQGYRADLFGFDMAELYIG